MKMMPEETAANIRRHCEGMADEIARRCAADNTSFHLTPATVRKIALEVWLDFLLGDFKPVWPEQPDEKTKANGA
jgi:hypothetical protein